MRRVHNSDIEFKLDKKIINVTNFSMKFYTVNPDNFFVRKTNDDVYEKERPVTIEDVEAIESGLTSVTEYYIALDWAELVNIGRGVMNYQAINNYNLNNFVDLWFNNSVTRTTEYYIDSDIVFSDADCRNVIEKVDDLGKDLNQEIQDRISADLVLSDRIDYIVEHMDSGGTIDPTRYYLKTETSGATELETAFAEKQNVLVAGENITISGNVISAAGGGGDMSNYYTKPEVDSALDEKLDASAYTPTDLSNYYTKSETSGATEIANGLSAKLDATAYTPTDLTNYYTKSETSGATEIATEFSKYYTKDEINDNERVIAQALVDLDERKLNASAYTPTDLTNYYTKTQTSAATEIATALGTKQNQLIAGDNITISGNVISSTGGGGDMSNYYTKQETSGATEISTALGTKLDSTAYTPTDLTNYYTKSQTSGATELETALSNKADSDSVYLKSETSGATEISTALNAKADAATIYTKTETDNAITAATSTKQDTLVSGKNIKTINNTSILGSGNIDIQSGGGKAVSGGTNISITTGETADTINCTLPIRYNNFYSVAFGHTANTLADYGSFTWGGTPFDSTSYNTVERFSQAGGYGCRADGFYSLAIGRQNSAKTDFSVALNGWNFTSNKYETTLGTGNVSVSGSSAFGDSGNTLFSVGNGRGNGAKNVHNAIEIRQNGDIYIADTNDTTYQNYYEKPMIKLQDKFSSIETSFGGMKIVKLTESEYSLVTKDSDTLYVVIPDPSN